MLFPGVVVKPKYSNAHGTYERYFEWMQRAAYVVNLPTLTKHSSHCVMIDTRLQHRLSNFA